MTSGGGFRLKRVYEPASPSDGERVLVDRLWPRGLSKEDAHVDEWAKDLSPSSDLRKWFHEDREGRFEEFTHRYAAELSAPDQQERIDRLREKAAKGTVTLLTGATDPSRSHASVLLEELGG